MTGSAIVMPERMEGWVCNMARDPSDHQDDDLIILGKTGEAANAPLFGISRQDRRRHLTVFGKTRSGKSVLAANLAKRDIQEGGGLCFIDTHGQESDRLLQAVPSWRTRQVIYWAPGLDTEQPYAWNLISAHSAEERKRAQTGVYDVFEHLYHDFWGPQTGNILRKSLAALFDLTKNPTLPPQTILGVYALIVSKSYRDWVTSHLQDSFLRAYWDKEFNEWSPTDRTRYCAPLQNKLGMFLDPPLVHIVGQVHSAIDPRFILDSRKILILNLDGLGDEEKRLFGSLVISGLYTVALTRDPTNPGPDFAVYVDEAQKFTTQSLVSSLAEAGKFNLQFILTSQTTTNLTPAIRDAILGNVGTLVTFRVGAVTAKHLNEEFASVRFSDNDLVDLQPYEILVKGPRYNHPVGGWALPPLTTNHGNQQAIRNYSRTRYGTPHKRVERKLKKWAKRWLN